jgi:hypothetical protein
MIQNDGQLQQVIEQIERLYQGLNALRRDILPKNPRNFVVLAEGPLDEIRKLQAAIDQYISRLDRIAAA